MVCSTRNLPTRPNKPASSIKGPVRFVQRVCSDGNERVAAPVDGVSGRFDIAKRWQVTVLANGHPAPS